MQIRRTSRILNLKQQKMFFTVFVCTKKTLLVVGFGCTVEPSLFLKKEKRKRIKGFDKLKTGLDTVSYGILTINQS